MACNQNVQEETVEVDVDGSVQNESPLPPETIPVSEIIEIVSGGNGLSFCTLPSTSTVSACTF